MGPSHITGWEASHSVSLTFINVPPTCVDMPIDIPCANGSAIDPALWWCEWRGVHANQTFGPYSAHHEVEFAQNVGSLQLPLAVRVMLTCPVPEIDLITTLAGYSGYGEDVVLEVVARYGAAADTSVPLPWVGIPVGGRITLHELPQPPSSPPSSPPPTPPPPPLAPPKDNSCRDLFNMGYNCTQPAKKTGPKCVSPGPACVKSSPSYGHG